MAYSPPKKITVIISLIILVIGLLLLYLVIFNILPEFLLSITIAPLTSYEFWGIIVMILVAVSWLLMFIGIKYRGI